MADEVMSSVQVPAANRDHPLPSTPNNVQTPTKRKVGRPTGSTKEVMKKRKLDEMSPPTSNEKKLRQPRNRVTATRSPDEENSNTGDELPPRAPTIPKNTSPVDLETTVHDFFRRVCGVRQAAVSAVQEGTALLDACDKALLERNLDGTLQVPDLDTHTDPGPMRGPDKQDIEDPAGEVRTQIEENNVGKKSDSSDFSHELLATLADTWRKQTRRVMPPLRSNAQFQS